MKVELPSSVSIQIEPSALVIRGPLGEVRRSYEARILDIEKIGDVVQLRLKEGFKPTRRMRAILNTTAAHLRNAVDGVTKGFEKRLVVVYAHFPISLEVKGDTVLIKNFLGERVPRRARIVRNACVEVRGSEVIVKGIDKEAVGQTALNLINATRIRRRDARVFQDGIYPAMT